MKRFLRIGGDGAARDTLWALLEQGTTLVSSTLSFLLLGRTLAAAGYGAFVGLYALMGPCLAFSSSGVYLTTLEHTVRWRERPADVARSSLSVTLLGGLLFAPLVSAMTLRSIEGIPAATVALLVGGEFFLNGALSPIIGMVQAVAGYPPAARLRMATALSRVGLLVALAGAGSLTLETLAVGQVLTLGAVMGLALLEARRVLGFAVLPGRVRRVHVRSTLLYGLGLGASSAQTDADKFVLNAAHFQADAGRYGAAYRLIQVAFLPLQALVGATHLSFLQGRDGADDHLRRAVRLSLFSLLYGIPAVIGLIVVAPWVPMILTRDFAGTSLMLKLLAPVVILRSVGAFPMNALLGLGRNGLRTSLLVANALVSVALYAALIPTYSWKGALAATLISESLLFASAWTALLCQPRPRPSAPEAGRAEAELARGPVASG